MQAELAVHGAQSPVVTLQKGVLPEQWLFWVHDWQRFVAALQFGLTPEQWPFMVHWTQRPAAQPGVVGLLAKQASSVVHAAHAPSTQVGLVGSRVQSPEVAHSTQAPARVPASMQRLFGAPQSLSLVHPRQLPAVVLHTGVMPAQWELPVHWTQVPVANRQ